MKPEFKDKMVAFVDIVGFSYHEKASESGSGMPFEQLLLALSKLGTSNANEMIRMGHYRICPQSKYIEENLDFQLTQISDCAIVSCEVSPVGVINLIFHCRRAVHGLLDYGMMCRGYITRGNVYHTSTQIVGTGYQRAVAAEKNVTAFVTDGKKGAPFVEVDESVCQYVEDVCDKNVVMMFKRFVKSDGKVRAINPFSLDEPTAVVDANYNAQRNLEQSDIVRQQLLKYKTGIMKNTDSTNPDAVWKADHYLRMIDEQLRECDLFDESTKMFTGTRPVRTLGDLLAKKGRDK